MSSWHYCHLRAGQWWCRPVPCGMFSSVQASTKQNHQTPRITLQLWQAEMFPDIAKCPLGSTTAPAEELRLKKHVNQIQCLILTWVVGWDGDITLILGTTRKIWIVCILGIIVVTSSGMITELCLDRRMLFLEAPCLLGTVTEKTWPLRRSGPTLNRGNQTPAHFPGLWNVCSTCLSCSKKLHQAYSPERETWC